MDSEPTPQSLLHSELDALPVERVALDPRNALLAGTRLADAANRMGDTRAQARAHLVVGGAHGFLGQATPANASLDRAATLFLEASDHLGFAETILRRNIVWGLVEDFDTALAELPKALSLARSFSDRLLEAQILDDMAIVLSWAGRVEEAVDHFGEAIRIAELIENSYWTAAFKINLADVLVDQQDYEAARSWLTEALSGHASRDASLAHDAECTLAICVYRMGDPNEALRLLSSAVARAEEVGFAAGIADASFEAGLICVAIEEIEQAREAFSRTVEIFGSWDTEPAPFRGALAQWWVEHLNGGASPEIVGRLESFEPRLEAMSDESAFMAFDALSESYERLGDAARALAYLKKSLKRKEHFWRQTALRQTHLASKKHQVDSERRAAESARRAGRELSEALETVRQLNHQNEKLIVQLKAQSELLERQATEDILTGIGNRRMFEGRLELELARSVRFGHPISVGLLDIDDFKQINDRYSHVCGDQVLVRAAARMSKELRDTDLLARYGGEEFAVILPETALGEAFAILDRIRIAVMNTTWSDLVGETAVTVSAGVASALASADRSGLISGADEQLYEAKRHGKNCVRSMSLDGNYQNMHF